MQESQESMESDVSLHTSLLIDSMALDYMEEEKQGVMIGASRGEAETRTTIYRVESFDSSLGTESKMENIQEKAVAAAKKETLKDAILTRDVTKRKKWGGNPSCSFCKERETSQHLCFTCRVARVVWRTIGCTLGSSLGPNNIWQFFLWCFMFLPNGARFFTFGLAAVCWALWNCRNRATFENKN
ncbi:uncharacterized protein LOC123413571 isoform X2 [Hordeum vulgare subsp. vulgare]|uniref:uncharacterized protein LOC123413571 isoform X2 n=1 Tax=Hordeum vulgare subsp. vulgare TaxID=112509 RepID=UPI001D1A4CD5|nr:uncharacterized protein LOC123413571 isoform X2 [Hordeum vulgare subsp. vulgare]